MPTVEVVNDIHFEFVGKEIYDMIHIHVDYDELMDAIDGTQVNAFVYLLRGEVLAKIRQHMLPRTGILTSAYNKETNFLTFNYVSYLSD